MYNELNDFKKTPIPDRLYYSLLKIINVYDFSRIILTKELITLKVGT